MLFLVLLRAIFHPFNITSAATDYDTFYLILIRYRFTLHGLWPITLDGKSPNYRKCKRIPLMLIRYMYRHILLIHSQIIHDLNNLWPSLEKNSANTKFWKHEWEHHGRCTTWEQFRYFQTSIERVKHANTLEMLKASDIIPNNSLYKIVDIM
ncbi:hypothetical protein MANES_04G075824v8 [Manihot esculenta]|uniref:Uncharacterized protein n=1 Tax=Manihot esculenta TaxID=3983 RepID=A0ACB7HW66_MANES|nr:hypothetical protein MANES_04G075824v8 [Manihot esculenta]